MKLNIRGVAVLRAIVNGQTFVEAGKSLGIGGARARQLLFAACRELKLPNEVSEIRARKKEYLSLLNTIEENPIWELNPNITKALVKTLKLKRGDYPTLTMLSNISASQLFQNGQTIISIAEIQRFMVRHETSLKLKPPQSEKELLEVERAIAILDAFFFDTQMVKKQLLHVKNE